MLRYMLCLVCLLVSACVNSTTADCQQKNPMQGYTKNVMDGTFYLIGQMKGFPYQDNEDTCTKVTTKTTDGGQTYQYAISFQRDDGSPGNIALQIAMDKNGAFHATSDNIDLNAVVLGGKANQYRILYSCNKDNGMPAVWIYYGQRVNGQSKIDPQSMQEINAILQQNNINPADVKDTNNSNCTN